MSYSSCKTNVISENNEKKSYKLIKTATTRVIKQGLKKILFHVRR